ncbi:MAG: hypothetical protein ABL878_15540 [Burkholderiales bacterium]
MKVTSRRKSRGFLMMAGLLIATTVAMAYFLTNLSVLRVGSYMRVFSAQSTLSRIEDSIVRYAAVNSRLPCPANPALDSSIAAAGFADADTTNTLAPTTCSYPVGVVPWRSLGLTANDVIDPWGRLVTYRVYSGTIGLTKAGGASRVNCDTDNGSTVESPPVSGLCATNTNTLKASFLTHPLYEGTKGLLVSDFGTTVTAVAYTLIIHGPTGLGGYLPSGARMTMPGATAADYANTQPSATVVKAAYSAEGVTAGAPGHFDDIVAYKTIDDLIRLAKLEARNWPEKALPAFTVATTSNMTTASTDPDNPHFMSTGTAAAQTAFTAAQVSFSGAPAETVVYGGAGGASTGVGSFGSCLWWPAKLTLNDSVTPRELRTYVEFAAIDNASDPFTGLTLGFLGGNDPLGAPTNSTCGTTSFSTTATGTSGLFNITVADPANIVVGLDAIGAGIGTFAGGAVATVTAVVGNTVTLSRANSAAVNGGVTFSNSRLIRRDLGWAGGTVSAYANRFAVEFDANQDTVTFATPPVPTANDPGRPHLAIDGSGVTHTSDAESCASANFGSGCNMPAATFPLVATTANQVSGESTISVASNSGIASGMSVTGLGIGLGATVLNVEGTTVSLATSGGVPVLNTLTLGANAVTFAALSANNFMQNGLCVFHSMRADSISKGCVAASGTTGAAGVNTITVPSGTQIAPGMGAYGGNIARGATVVSVAGTTVTLSDVNAAAVNERISFGLLPATTKSATGLFLNSTIAVSDSRGIGVGMTVAGTSVGPGAKVTNVAGTTVTLSVANTGAVSGTLTFTPPNQSRTASGIAGQNTIVVGDATGIVTGMEVFGFGIGSGATVAGIAGTTLTLSAANTLTISGTVYVRPSQTLLKSWTLASAACGADAATCNTLKDMSTSFGLDLITNSQALSVVACIATPTPSTSFNDLYFGFTSSNRSTNVLTVPGANLALRRLTVLNPISQ